jgi:hypothetical protein
MAYDHAKHRKEVDAVIHAAWPECVVIMDAHQAERRSLGGLTPPFCIVARGQGEDSDWGLSNICQERVFGILYCMGWDDADIDLIEQKIELLKNAMLTASFSNATLLQIEEDCSTENPANTIALGQNFQLAGGTLLCRFVVGESAN